MSGKAIRQLLSLTLCCLILTVSAGCTAPEQKASGNEHGLKVAATIFPLADLARCVGGEKVEVITLLPPGASPHTFEVTPKQAKKLADVDIFIKIGAGVDDWVDNLISIAQGAPSVVTVSSGVELRRNGDPHIWLDPVLVKEHIAPVIADEMCAVRPDQREHFTANLGTYTDELELLHREIKGHLDAISGKKIISLHSCWGYFCDRYEIEEIATIEESPGKEPSAAWIANVIGEAERNNIRAVFAEPQLNPKAAETIANEFGGRVVFPDPIGGEGIQGKDSYIELMQYNTKIFIEAFKPV